MDGLPDRLGCLNGVGSWGRNGGCAFASEIFKFGRWSGGGARGQGGG